MPSRIATSAWPCDSPAVRNRSIGAHSIRKNLRRLEGDRSISRTIRAGRFLAPRTSAQEEEETMRLVADRFVVYDDRRAVDLATTRPVWLSLDRSREFDER